MSVIRDTPLRAVLEKDGSIAMHFATFQGLKASLFKVFGSTATAIIYDAGTEPGRRSFLTLMRDCKTKKDVLELLIQYKANENWGDVEFHNINWQGHSGKVSVARCFESRGVQSGDSQCYFFKGYLAGFLSELFASEVTVVEVRCNAKGDALCEFAFQ
jgi:predicted hydrocarbon binding protein